jgi:hypothetical protein
MMIDMCVVYGRANNDLVSKMLANLFKQQPAYVKTSHFFFSFLFLLWEHAPFFF